MQFPKAPRKKLLNTFHNLPHPTSVMAFCHTRVIESFPIDLTRAFTGWQGAYIENFSSRDRQDYDKNIKSITLNPGYIFILDCDLMVGKDTTATPR